MRFWDSSAIVPLLVEEPRSLRCRLLLRADPKVVVWCLTRTECISAIRRQVRESGLSEASARKAEDRLEKHARRWSEVDAVGPVRESAERLLRLHPLRAADALQLAAALFVVEGRARRRQFVALDEALSSAADREGFDVVGTG